MSKRDYIEEITSIKDRSQFPGGFELVGRLYAIDSIIYDSIEDDTVKNKEILKYIPIATVACFESFFRSIVSELIDKGEPYNQNVVKFNQTHNVRFDFNIVNAIHKNKISIGDFISHVLSCNNIKDFNSNLSILTQTNFLEELKQFEPKKRRETSIDIAKKFKENHSRILESIDYTFRVRHIFCHEFASNVELEYLMIKGTYEHCKIFLFQVKDYISDLLFPNAPTTQTEMTAYAAKNFEKVESELNKIIEKIKNLDLSQENIYLDSKDIDLVIKKWKEYREVKAESFAKQAKGGTMHSTLRLNSLKNTTEKMIGDLIEEYGLEKANR